MTNVILQEPLVKKCAPINGRVNGKAGVLPTPQTNQVSRFRKLINSQPVLVCPYIGLKDDPETLTNYASVENHCHCSGHARPIPLDHQQMHCLFGYTGCPMFLKHMAEEVQARENADRQRYQNRHHKPKASPGMVGLLISLLGIK